LRADRTCGAAEGEIEFGLVACHRRFFRIKGKVSGAGGQSQSYAIVGCGAIRPRLNQRRDIDEDECTLAGCGNCDWVSAGYRNTQWRSVVEVQGALAPAVVELIDIETARLHCGIYIQAQRGFIDDRARRQHVEVELHVSGNARLKYECGLGSVIRCGVDAAAIGVSTRWRLSHGWKH
jgi:hypothetical protein